MSESKQNATCQVCNNASDARLYGKCGIWYTYTNERRQFPDDVESVMIIMPVDGWGGNGLSAEWTVSKKNQCNAQWSLSGTYEKPTLHPSLHWVNVWHGWLQDGELKSC